MTGKIEPSERRQPLGCLGWESPHPEVPVAIWSEDELPAQGGLTRHGGRSRRRLRRIGNRRSAGRAGCWRGRERVEVADDLPAIIWRELVGEGRHCGPGDAVA